LCLLSNHACVRTFSHTAGRLRPSVLPFLASLPLPQQLQPTCPQSTLPPLTPQPATVAISSFKIQCQQDAAKAVATGTSPQLKSAAACGYFSHRPVVPPKPLVSASGFADVGSRGKEIIGSGNDKDGDYSCSTGNDGGGGGSGSVSDFSAREDHMRWRMLG
jgi:hypothetical protein